MNTTTSTTDSAITPGVTGLDPATNIGGFVFLLAAIGFYFLPTIVANRRGNTSASGVAALNLLLGWTVLGWIIALVWAYSGLNRQQRQQIETAKDNAIARAMAATRESTWGVTDV